jgi:hypothetical protein
VRFALAVLFITSVAQAAPPQPTGEPTGPHPRLLLDAKLRAAWRAELDARRGPLIGAVTLCEDDRERKHEGSSYMGSEWAKMLQACLVAWAATDKPAYATTAIKYFTALLDDLETVGDGKGGDKAATRDSGYAIRNLGPYTALAYDWLHRVPEMTPQLRDHARQRWAAWLTWFRDKGYHPRDPGSNYQAGFLLAATMIAIAQGGEAAEQSGPALWKFVADSLWGKDMAAALAVGGALDGGDWNEGWQYGPLSVAEYALAARVGKQNGLAIDGVPAWLASVLRRHVYALTPSDRLWAGGDFDDEHAYMAPQVMVLAAVALGDASRDDKRWAKGELSRLRLVDQDWLLYDALALVGDPPALVPREAWPTWYQAAATATLFTRTTWDERAIWFVAACAQTNGLDHRSPNAGNFVLSRGAADLIVDPSPYGSLSTLTGNAPTVVSGQLPADYRPSQGAWSETIGWAFATKTRSGVVAARCNYADAYKFQDHKSDVPEALRDFVLLPGRDGHDASLVVIDRATTGGAEHSMHLRFRVPAELGLDRSGTASAAIKDARLAISGTAPGTAPPASPGAALPTPGPTIARTALKDCFQPGTKRGNCDAARFPVTDYRVELAGPTPRAVHVIDATGADASARHTAISGDGWTGLAFQRPRQAVVVWPTRPGASLSYRASKGEAGAPVSHIVLDAPATDGKATLAARPEGDGCAVTVTAGGSLPARPLIAVLDAACAVVADPEQPAGTSAEGKPVKRRAAPSLRRAGCCAAQAAPGSPLALSAVVIALLWRRKRAAQ